MWLASHLCEKRVITTEQFAESVRLQLTRRRPLGSLAVKTGALSIKQVMAVLSAQADDLDRPFGELAVELGFLSNEELAQLIFEQAERVPALGEILVEIGAMSREDYRRELRDARMDSCQPEGASRSVCVTQ